MALETGNFINDLNQTYPTATDTISEGDGHLQLIKKVLKQSFAGVDRVSEYIYVHTSAPTVDVGKGRLWLDTSTTPNLLKICNAAGPPATFIKLPISATINYKLMGNDTVGWVLPTADGTANYPLTTTGSNVLAFAQIATAAIADDAVTAAKIVANAVGSSELADDAVDTAAIADDAVTTAKIADTQVTTAKLSLTRPMFSATDTGTSLTSGSTTLIAFATENFDIESKYLNTATNYKFTPNAGYYLITAIITVQSPLALAQYGKLLQCTLHKNGSEHNGGVQELFPYNANPTIQANFSDIVYSNGTDYWQVKGYQNSGSTLTTHGGTANIFCATRVDV